MSRTRRFRWLGIAATSMIASVVILSACADGAEGDRCQVQNGNDDCQPGLVCLASGHLNGVAIDAGPDGSPDAALPGSGLNGGNGTVNPPYDNSDRCCPLDRTTATSPACTPPNQSVGGEASIPPADTGPAVDATTDTGATDSGADAADASDAADANDADADSGI